MTTMLSLPTDRLAGLLADYPTTDNAVLADRYGLTAGVIEDLARSNQVVKVAADPSLIRAASARKGHDGHQPASPRRPHRPTITNGDHCEGCGQTNYHWPGCPRIGTDDRPVLPAAR